MLGQLAAARIRAGLVAAAVNGEAEPAGELLGLVADAAAPDSFETMRARRPGWFADAPSPAP